MPYHLRAQLWGLARFSQPLISLARVSPNFEVEVQVVLTTTRNTSYLCNIARRTQDVATYSLHNDHGPRRHPAQPRRGRHRHMCFLAIRIRYEYHGRLIHRFRLIHHTDTPAGRAHHRRTVHFRLPRDEQPQRARYCHCGFRTRCISGSTVMPRPWRSIGKKNDCLARNVLHAPWRKPPMQCMASWAAVDGTYH